MRRSCSRSACAAPAVATLTFAYADSQAVLGPLVSQAEPGCYDLCATHAASLSVPRGWEVLRLIDDVPQQPAPDEDDLVALANAVREAGFADHPAAALEFQQPTDALPDGVVELGRRGHLSLIADAGR